MKDEIWCCGYCGKENREEWANCGGCGQDAEEVRSQPKPQERPLPPISQWSEQADSAGTKQLEGRHSETHPPDEWVQGVRNFYGGNFRVTPSETILLMSPLEEPVHQELLKFASSSLHFIRKELRLANNQGVRLPVLIFNEEDDYYHHISHFYPDGEHPMSGGIYIHSSGCDHIAIPSRWDIPVRPIMAHELTHFCVAHLPLPLWLNENLAIRFENHVSKQGLHLDVETADEQYEHWRQFSIQRFWTGESFKSVQESKASYALAEILGAILIERAGKERFLHFVHHADYKDGGQSAALECLGIGLDEALEGFLGDGHWTPCTRTLAEFFCSHPEYKD